jgi:hypothetical protein
MRQELRYGLWAIVVVLSLNLLWMIVTSKTIFETPQMLSGLIIVTLLYISSRPHSTRGDH